jgi:hypothetical protein
MDKKISQDGSPESRPNLRSDDDTLFVYNRHGGIYEPYKRSEEDNYEKSTTPNQSTSGRFAKHWRKHWIIWVPVSINFLTLVVVAIYTYYARQQVCVSMKAVDSANRSIKTTRSHMMPLVIAPELQLSIRKMEIASRKGSGVNGPAPDCKLPSKFRSCRAARRGLLQKPRQKTGELRTSI